MSNAMSAVTKTTFKILLNGEKVEVARFKHLCMMNDYVDGSSWGGCQSTAQRSVENAAEEWAERETKPKYILNRHDSLKSTRLHGVVFKPKSEFDGTTCEHLENLEEVGTVLVNDDGHYYIETDLEKIELERRAIEIQGMKNKTRWIGFEGATCTEDTQNPTMYQAFLDKRDAEHGKMFTRGYRL